MDEASTRQPLARGLLAVPRHIAIIMDGNGRWAHARGLKRADGHREGVKSVREIVEACGELQVEVLTLYAFSTENWKRPPSEVEALMHLLVDTISREVEDLRRNNVQLRVIGRWKEFKLMPRKTIEYAVDRCRGNTGLILNLALSYGGRQEIVDAANASLQTGVRELTEQSLADRLYTAGLPDPDLLIRTSGEMRISNFLLWQLAYAEIVVTDVLWPDFRKPQLMAAIEEFGRRQRRYGQVVEAD
jgi:undecaprenyl diphosphate synthase